MSLSAFLVALLVQSVAFSAIMSGAWIIQQSTGNSGWVDAVWTFGLGLVGSIAALLPLSADDMGARQLIVAGLLLVWSLRLGLHIASRTAGIADDPRYAELIRGWGSDAPRQMFWLLQKQALVTIPLSMSVLLAAHNPAPDLTLQDGLAVLVLLAAIIGEAIADRQLQRFRADPANHGKVCDVGLWRWSRHPNYFFEFVDCFPLCPVRLSRKKLASNSKLSFTYFKIKYFMIA